MWLYWLDTAGAQTPHRVWHSRAVWHRVASARRHELRWVDAARMETLELAALLHDIGRVLDPTNSSTHALTGAAFLDDLGLFDVAPLVAHHSGARAEAAERGLAHLDRWTSDPDLLAILTYIDHTTSPKGESVTVDERRRELLHRRGTEAAHLRWFDSCIADVRLGARLMSGRPVVSVA
jgi:hypothetical protein